MSLELVWNTYQEKLDRLEELSPFVKSKKASSVRILITGVKKEDCNDRLHIAYDQKLKRWTVKSSLDPNPKGVGAQRALFTFLNGRNKPFSDDGYVGTHQQASRESSASKTWQVKSAQPASSKSTGEAAASALTASSLPAKPKLNPCRSHFESPQALLKHIRTVLAATPYDEDVCLECYAKVTETLLSDEWSLVQERNKDGSIKKIQIDSEVEMTVKRLIVHCVEHKYSEFLALDMKNPASHQKKQDWINEGRLYSGSCVSLDEVLPYAAQLASWTLILRHAVFQLSPNDSANELRYKLRDLFYDLVPGWLLNYFSIQAHANAQPYNRRALSNACDTWKAEQQKDISWRFKGKGVDPSVFDKLELYLHLVEKRPLTDATISSAGCCVNLPKKPEQIPPKMKRTSSEAVSLRLTPDNKVDPLLLEAKPLVLPHRADYQAVLTVLFPENGHLYFVPKLLGEDEAAFNSKLDVLLANEDSRIANLVFISIQQGSLSLLNTLDDRFAQRSQFNIVTPFRGLTGNEQFKPKHNLWAFQHYSLMAADLTDAIGNFSFVFHTQRQEFQFALKSHGATYANQTENFIAPYTWSQEATRELSARFAETAMLFTLSVMDRMTCPITLNGIAQIETPCFDKAGNIYEKSELLKSLQDTPRNPVSNEPMTKDDILDLPIFSGLIAGLRAQLLLHDIENTPNSSPLLKVLEAKQKQAVQGADLVQQKVRRRQETRRKAELARRQLEMQRPGTSTDGRPVFTSSSDDDIAQTKRQNLTTREAVTDDRTANGVDIDDKERIKRQNLSEQQSASAKRVAFAPAPAPDDEIAQIKSQIAREQQLRQQPNVLLGYSSNSSSDD